MSQEYFEAAIARKRKYLKYDLDQLMVLLSRFKEEAGDDSVSSEYVRTRTLHSQITDFAEQIKEIETLYSALRDFERFQEYQENH